MGLPYLPKLDPWEILTLRIVHIKSLEIHQLEFRFTTQALAPAVFAPGLLTPISASLFDFGDSGLSYNLTSWMAVKTVVDVQFVQLVSCSKFLYMLD